MTTSHGVNPRFTAAMCCTNHMYCAPGGTERRQENGRLGCCRGIRSARAADKLGNDLGSACVEGEIIVQRNDVHWPIADAVVVALGGEVAPDGRKWVREAVVV